MEIRVALEGLLQLFFELGDGFWGVLLQVIVAFGSTDFILWSLGGLGDVLDMVDNQGMVKIEEMKRPSLVALTGDVI